MSHSLITSALLTVLTDLATARQPKGLVPASASAANQASRRPLLPRPLLGVRADMTVGGTETEPGPFPAGPQAGDGDRDPATRILCSLSRFCWRPCYPGVHGLHRPGSASPDGKPDEPLAWLTRASRNTRASPSRGYLARREPSRCHIVAVLTASMSHRCGSSARTAGAAVTRVAAGA